MTPAYLSEADVAKMRRAAVRRVRALQRVLLPCPKCGETPEVDLGFLDAQAQSGEEFISCPAVYEVGGNTVSCGTFSIGAAHWNFRRVPA